MVLNRSIIVAAIFSLALTLGSAAQASSEKQIPPAKAVKQAEAKFKRLIKEGEDRPSVYEARLELAQALRNLDSCDVHDRMDNELAAIATWIEHIGIPVRINPQLIYNEIGRTAQARAYCTENEELQKSHHEAALRAFERAREAARQDHDALSEAVTLFNASASAEALGDLPRAIGLMEQACAIDREYGLHENYMEDYRALVRLQDAKRGVETPPESLDRHFAALAEDKVALSFKAVHGDRQRYRSEMRKLTMTGGQRQEQKMELQYSSAISVKDDLVTVSMQPADSKIDGRDVKSVAADAANLTPEDLIARLLAQPLSYTVKTSGEFVGATGLAEMRTLVLARIDESLAGAEAADQRARARQLADKLLSDAMINQQIADEWAMAVGWWVDAELDLGDWYTLDVDAPQLLLPDSTLKYTYSFKVNRRLACNGGDAKKSCVELIIEGRPDRGQFADYMVAAMTQLAGKQSRKQMRWFRDRLAEDAEMVERHVLVVEPGTLKTYRQLKTKRTYVSAGERSGSPKVEQQTLLAELQPPLPEPKRAQPSAKPTRSTRNATVKAK
jgi:tetratricopeptide (TPR) repeat protein